jgi:hypothetical protein
MDLLLEKVENLRILGAHSGGQDGMRSLIDYNAELLKIEDQIANFDLFLDSEFKAIELHQDVIKSFAIQNKQLLTLVRRIPADRYKEAPQVVVEPKQKKKKKTYIEPLSSDEFQSLPSYLGMSNLK